MYIKRFINCIFFFLSFLFTFSQVKGQTLAQDSLILVSLYNKIPALQSDTTWLNGNLSTWNRISITNNRVQFLDLTLIAINDSIPREICGLSALNFLGLNACGLIGYIPSCIIEMSSLRGLYFNGNLLIGVEPGADFTQLTQIQNIGISNNNFSEMPDFMSIPSPDLNSIDARSNDFNFDDLIPLTTRSLNQYLYDSQHEIGLPLNFYVNVGGATDFPDVSLFVTDSNNSYSWKALVGQDKYVPSPDRFTNINTPILHVEGAQLEDYKLYHCEITNPNLPNLVLITRAMTLMVIDPFLPHNIFYLSDSVVYCSDQAMLLNAVSSANKPISFVSLNDSIATVNSDNTLTPHALGEVTIQATAPGDTLYHAASLAIHITVSSHLSLPSLEITQELPKGEGGDLNLSVPEIASLSYLWNTPTLQTYNTAAINISPLTSSDLGLYNVRISEGTCLRSERSTAITSLIYGEPIVYELITPNGDGDNETFYIRNLNPTIQNEVSIFNAAHQIVYHEENYRNNWDGANLPVGTYYYVLKYGGETYKGNLYIKR